MATQFKIKVYDFHRNYPEEIIKVSVTDQEEPRAFSKCVLAKHKARLKYEKKYNIDYLFIEAYIHDVK